MRPIPVIILPQAKADIGRSAQHFDQVRPGYGQLFIQHLYFTLQHIRTFPESCQRFRGDCRRAILHRFHHAVVYRCLPDRIEIVGVMDDRRDPLGWKDRTG
jgi:hypothetical protein